MSVIIVRTTYACQIFGEHCRLGSINVFDVNDFLQVVDVDVDV